MFPIVLKGMNDAIKRCLGPGDFIRIRKAHQISPVDSLVFGEVLGAVREDQLRCRMYCSMTTAILTKFTLQPIITSFFPVAARTVNTEVVATNIIEDLTRDAVEDIVFILPIQEFESGNVFVTGATNVYFVRFIMDQAQSSITNFSSTNFFGYHFIQPLTVRIFGALNTLAYTIKKLMYHRPEAEDTKRSTRIFFTSDAFHYLVYKMQDVSAIKCCSSKKQRVIKYYDDLKSESTSKVVDVTILRVITRSALMELRSILGVGIGLGSTQYKPSKTRPLQYCTINTTLTSVECAPVLPQQLIRKPLYPWYADGIDLSFYEQNTMLSCQVRFSRLRITTPEVATSRITAANVVADNPGAYVGAWFEYDNKTFEVYNIESGTCYCHCMEEEGLKIELPNDIVNDLVGKFGS